MDLPLYQDLAKQVVFQSKSIMLSEDFVPVFLLMFHPPKYHLGYDGNRFIDKPYLPMTPLV
jgi:hypothetical protein